MREVAYLSLIFTEMATQVVEMAHFFSQFFNLLV